MSSATISPPKIFCRLLLRGPAISARFLRAGDQTFSFCSIFDLNNNPSVLLSLSSPARLFRIFSKVSQEHDRRVREAAHKANGAGQRTRKMDLVAPNFSPFVGSWTGVLYKEFEMRIWSYSETLEKNNFGKWGRSEDNKNSNIWSFWRLKMAIFTNDLK